MRAALTLLIAGLAFPVLAQDVPKPQAAPSGGCDIRGEQMVCQNGRIIINGIGRSVFIGGKALAPGTGVQMPDGREIQSFGNSGVIIGGQGQAERHDAPPRP